MDIITEDDFKKAPAKVAAKPLSTQEHKGMDLDILSEEDFKESVDLHDLPTNKQKEIAAILEWQSKRQINEDLLLNGKFTPETLKLVQQYGEILDKLHRNLHGTKSSMMVGGKVTHAVIAQHMRRSEEMSEAEIVDVQTREQLAEDVEGNLDQ